MYLVEYLEIDSKCYYIYETLNDANIKAKEFKYSTVFKIKSGQEIILWSRSDSGYIDVSNFEKFTIVND